jgi:hypothetical protein
LSRVTSSGVEILLTHACAGIWSRNTRIALLTTIETTLARPVAPPGMKLSPQAGSGTTQKADDLLFGKALLHVQSPG